jgi:antitoxin (DNA-binding transcriptional repressor) of toxin-antitoxin stability system
MSKLDKSLNEEVIVTREDGSKFKIIPIDEKQTKGHSPLENIKGIKANVSTEELVDIIRAGREGRE